MATLRQKLGYRMSRLKRVGDAQRLWVSDGVDIRQYSCHVGGANGNRTRERLEMRK